MSHPETVSRLRHAEQSLRAGQVAAAAALCRGVLGYEPDNAAALQLLGLAQAQSGDVAAAEASLRRCLDLAPKSASAHTNLGNLLALKGDLEGAAARYRKALTLNPAQGDALVNLGIALKKLGRSQEALELLRSARPDHADAQVQLGIALLESGARAEAVAALDTALRLKPDHFDALYTRGLALMSLGRHDEAVRSLAEAARLRQNSHEAFFALGRALHLARNFTLAHQALARAVMLNPKNPEVHAAMGSVLLDMGRPEQALEGAQHAVSLEPGNGRHYIVLGRAFSDLNRVEHALAAHERAVELLPDSAEALNFLGNAYLSVGRGEDACEAFARSVTLAPDDIRMHYDLARATRFVPGDPRLARLEGLAAQAATARDVFPRDLIRLQFALGKAYDELGDYDRAFGHFRDGNARQDANAPYDEAGSVRHFDAIREVFTPELAARHAGAGSASRLPILIVGMPRSGTTLVEQIISSHPQVNGAGEVLELDIAFTSVCARHGLKGHYPEDVPKLPRGALREIGDLYAERLARRAPGSRHVTDKLPGNYHHIGLIHLALPLAKIIHCTRDAADTCLSGYTNLFGEKLGFVNELGAFGRLYRRYDGLMRHWRALLPEEAFLDVRYEELVGDFEPGARRIIAYCGLPWDPACLDFQNNARPVNTVSVTQVRQQIYSSSVARWRRYEKHLTPLFEALGDLAPRL
jgi:tetratricopeptide (TPR) repeat protein